MNRLYNKILNEVYLVQDFDSWDNSADTFKSKIKDDLKDKTFVYKKSEIISYNQLALFNSNYSPGTRWYSLENSYEWPFYHYYIIENNISITENGKRIKLNDDGTFTDKEIEENILYSFEITGLDGIPNTSKMFASTDIVKVPLFNTNKCENMSGMFQYCDMLEQVPCFDMSRVTDCHDMFHYCDKLKSVPAFNLPNVTNMVGMFSYCHSLENVPLFKNIKNSKLVNISRMFFCVEGRTAVRGSGKLNKETVKAWEDYGYDFQTHRYSEFDDKIF